MRDGVRVDAQLNLVEQFADLPQIELVDSGFLWASSNMVGESRVRNLFRPSSISKNNSKDLSTRPLIMMPDPSWGRLG